MSEKGSLGKPSPVPEDRNLDRRVGIAGAVVSGVGIIIGAGIYVIVGAAAGRAGNAVWMSFAIAAFGAMLTGLSYARLGRLRPRNAPEFQFLGMAFGRLPGFLGGWLILWAAVISASTVALGFAGYLQHLLDVPVLPGAIGLILLSALIVFAGVGQSVAIAAMLTVVSVIGLLFIIGIGVPYMGEVSLIEMPQGFSGVVAAASLVFFAYIGFQGMVNFSDEMRNPARDLPRALLLALVITTTLYILVALAAVSAVGWRDLSASEQAPLAVVAEIAVGSNADLLIAVLALASTANTVLLILFAASRILWAMSCEQAIPKMFCVIGKERSSPWAAIAVVTFFTSVFAAVRSIEQVAGFTNFVTLLAFAGVNAAAIKLLGMRGNPAAKRPGHILVNIILPGLGAVFTLALAASAGWQAAAVGTGLVVLGTGTYAVIRSVLNRSR
ncbi:MAG: amino acid permease [Dehalococcoidia bacterium]|nr:amino acid permease [Dehalococcoidia bacterium]